MGVFDSSSPTVSEPQAQQPARDIFGSGAQPGQPGLHPTGENPFTAVPPGQNPNETPPIAKIATGVNKALDFQRNAVAKKLTGKNTYDEQMAAIRHHIPGMDTFYNALSNPTPAIGPNLGPLEGPTQATAHFLHHAAQGIIDASLAAATDPLTYETMAAGPLVESLAKIPKLASAVEAIQRGIINNPVGSRAYDALHWAGAVERGGKYPSAYLRGASGVAQGEGGVVRDRMQRYYDTAMQGLSDESKVRINQVKNGELDASVLNPAEAKGLRRLNVLTNLDLSMRRMAYATIEARTIREPEIRQAVYDAIRTGKAPVIPNPELDQRANELYSAVTREAEKEVPERVNYFPVKNLGQKEPGREGLKFNVSEHFDPRTLERQDVMVTNPKQVQEGYQAMFTNAGRVRAQAVLNRVLDTALDDPEVKKVFQVEVPATGEFRNNFEVAKDALRTIVGYPRAATVSLSPRHIFNIWDLAVNTVPPDKLGQFHREVASMFVKMLKSNPKEYENLTQESRETFGTMGTGFAEHKPFFQHFPDEIPIPLTNKTLQVPKAIAGKEVPVLARWTRFNNKMVWAFDQAVKTVYAKIIKQSGEATRIAEQYGERGNKPYENLVAGGLSQERLIDYERRTGLQNFLRYIAPFGTFRGGIPQAVGGGIIRNPARAAFLSRASGGAMYGDRPDTKAGSAGYVMSNPTSDVGELSGYFGGGKNPFEGPARFGKATLGNLPSDIWGFTSNLAQQGGPHAPTMWRDPVAYGQQWFPGMDRGRFDMGVLVSQALQGVLEAQQTLEAMGISRYQLKGLAQELGRQVTGVQYQAPAP